MDYKEKLRLAKEALDSGSYDKETIEYIFPELKESEDEKIRKDIIVYLQYSMAFDKSFLDKKYNWSQKDCSKWIAWLEKQGEQNPANKKEEVDNLHNYLYGEQNPAWSEGDEEMFDAIIADIRFTQKAHNHEVNQVVYEEEIDWLKSLKDRYTWKPSEEQIRL